jgi:hypothetical protein
MTCQSNGAWLVCHGDNSRGTLDRPNAQVSEKEKIRGKKGQDNLVSFIDMPKFKLMSGILQKMIIRNTRNKKKQCKKSTHTIEQTLKTTCFS